MSNPAKRTAHDSLIFIKTSLTSRIMNFAAQFKIVMIILNLKL